MGYSEQAGARDGTQECVRRGQMDGCRQDKKLQLMAVYQQNCSWCFGLTFVLGSPDEQGCVCAGS